ncbi:MAG: glycine cleavage system protein GcvH [Bacteroidales bacterium]|nr:glycine cleavage system protein GcvH [Bacteroidales bacterium]
MNFPQNLKYTKDHEWLKIDGDSAFIGITEFAVSELGDIVFIEIETQGETLAQGDTFGSVEAVKTVSDLFMPVGGEILEVNPTLEDTPELVNSSPYDEGWLVKIKIENSDELNGLLSADDYKSIVG